MVILNKGERGDSCYGIETDYITDEMISALKEGNRLYTTIQDGEYALILKHKGKKKTDSWHKLPDEDVISRQAVLDKKELVELEDGQSFYCISPEDVEKLPSVTPQPKWTPVSEGLPELDENQDKEAWEQKIMITGYLSFDDKKELFVSEAFINDIINNSVQDTVVVAWMPLPQPYKAESEG